MTTKSPVYYDSTAGLVYNPSGTEISLILPFSPEQFAQLGDPDDTLAWQRLATAVQSAGGGRISCPPNKVYNVYNAGQAIDPDNTLCDFTSISGVSIYMNGSTFSVGRKFQATPVNVTNIVSGTGGVCRVTISGNLDGIYTGDSPTVAGVTGTTEANGNHAITIISSTVFEIPSVPFVHAYVSGGTVTAKLNNVVLLSLVSSSDVWADGWEYTQTNATSLPISLQNGTLGIVISGTGGQGLTFINPRGAGGLGVIGCSGNATDAIEDSMAGIVILGGSATNCVYGQYFANNGNRVFSRNFKSSGCERSYFPYGVQDHDVDMTSINPIANDALISVGGDATHIRPTSNIRLNYRYLKRTSGVSSASLVTFSLGGTGFNNGIIENVQVNIYADYSGEATTLCPAVEIIKNTTSARASSIKNIKIGGQIKGVPALSGNLIDLFVSVDAPWSSETASGLCIKDLLVEGSSTPGFRADLAALSAVGSYTLENITFPGNYTETNAAANVRFAENANFASGSLNPATGSFTIASQAEAEAGTENTKGLTSLRGKQAIDFQRPYASQAEAEAGTENTKVTTSLRVSQAIAALAPGGGTLASQAEAEAGTQNTHYMSPLRTAQAIAALASGGGWHPVVKASDENCISDATLNNDSALLFTMAASTKYIFRGVIFFDTPAAADFKFGLNGPASPSVVRMTYTTQEAAGGPVTTDAISAYETSGIGITGSGTTGGYVIINGIIHNGANAGDVHFSWCQNTSTASNTTVRAKSYIEWM